MWRLFGIAALLVLTLQPAAAATLDRVRETKTFRIGYRADAKPHSYRTEQGRPAGCVVDLRREVAAAIVQLIENVRVTFVLVPADRRFAALRDGRVDILGDPRSVTLARRELVDFSLPTFLDGASVLSRSGQPVERFEDLAGEMLETMFIRINSLPER